MAFDTITINNAKVTDKGVEMRTSKNGNQYASLTVMWSSSRKDKAGGTEYGPTKFVKVTVTGYEAQDVAANIKPGDRVNVTGRIQHFEWQSNNGPKDDWSISGSVSLPVPRAQQQGSAWPEPNTGNAWATSQPTQQQAQQNGQTATSGAWSQPAPAGQDQPPF